MQYKGQMTVLERDADARRAAFRGKAHTPHPAAQPHPAAPPAKSAPAAGPSLDAMSLAKGVLMDQLSSPAKLIGLIVAVAFVAYRVGTVVSTRRWIRLSAARGFSPDA